MGVSGGLWIGASTRDQQPYLAKHRSRSIVVDHSTVDLSAVVRSRVRAPAILADGLAAMVVTGRRCGCRFSHSQPGHAPDLVADRDASAVVICGRDGLPCFHP